MADSGEYDMATKLRRRALAEAMMKAPDKPMTHWAQGLSHLANSAVGGYDLAKLDAEDRQRQNSDRIALAQMLGTSAPAASDIKGKSGASQVAAALGWDFPGNSAPSANPAAMPALSQPAASSPPVTPPMGNVGAAMSSASDASLPRGFRNNNPGNIEDGTFARSQPGYSGSDGRFAKFASMDNGTGAMGTLLDSYNKRGLNTVNGIINRWAPSSDGNNVSAYAANVSKQLGIGPDDPIPPEMKSRLVAAMALHENGRPLPQSSAAPASAPQTGGVLSGATPDQRRLIALGMSSSPGSTANKVATAMMSGLIGKSPLDQEIKQADLQSKTLSNAKLARELQGEGAVPLSAEERTQFGIPENLPAYKTRAGDIKFGPAGTKITNNVGGEPADGNLRKELDKKTADVWAKYTDQGATSASMTQDMQVLDELAKSAPQGPIQGRLAEMFPGVSSSGDAFQSIVKRIAPTLRAPGSGSTSDIEYDGMLRSLPALRNRPEANAAISQIMQAKAQLNIERSETVSAYRKGEITSSDAERRISEINKRSIMTPEMRKTIAGLSSSKSSTPLSGDVMDGYRFKGGDPANQSSWEKVQ